jgi:hypothetical protein
MEWREPVKVLADVLKDELALASGQIMLGYQNWPIPKNAGMFVAISTVSTKPVGTNNFLRDAEGGAEEVQQIVSAEVVQIDAMSFDNTARTRKEEILLALGSMRCQRAMIENHMQIARIPQNFLNASTLEETGMLKRFTVTLVIQSIKTKVKAAEYYDTILETEVHANG